MTDISLHLLGAARQLPIEELPAVTSRHTDRRLRRVSLQLQVPEDQHEELEGELKASTGATGRPLEGGGTRWLVEGNRLSYTDGRHPQVYTHDVGLREAEQLGATSVEVNGLILMPSGYQELADPLLLTFVVEVREEALEKLEEMLVARGDDAYFDVIRHGVSDVPVQMHFGQCLWEDKGAGTRRHDLTLVADKEVPVGKRSGFALLNQPQLDRTTEATVSTGQALTLLVEELRAQGVLSEEAATKVTEALIPHELSATEHRAFSKTYDLDDYLD